MFSSPTSKLDNTRAVKIQKARTSYHYDAGAVCMEMFVPGWKNWPNLREKCHTPLECPKGERAWNRGRKVLSKFSAPTIAFLAFWLAEKLRLYNNYSMSPCWIWSDYNQLALRARWLFYHFISNSGSRNNCYTFLQLTSCYATTIGGIYVCVSRIERPSGRNCVGLYELGVRYGRHCCFQYMYRTCNIFPQLAVASWWQFSR